jgi:hypothetical protein
MTTAASTSPAQHDVRGPAKHRWLITIIAFAFGGPIIGTLVAVAGFVLAQGPSQGFSADTVISILTFPLTWLMAVVVGFPSALVAGIAVSAALARGRHSVWFAVAVGVTVGALGSVMLLGGAVDPSSDSRENIGLAALVLVILPSLVSTLICWRMTRGLWTRNISVPERA